MRDMKGEVLLYGMPSRSTEGGIQCSGDEAAGVRRQMSARA
jgi:hypothetical protein